jgi:hypothetical protein
MQIASYLTNIRIGKMHKQDNISQTGVPTSLSVVNVRASTAGNPALHNKVYWHPGR